MLPLSETPPTTTSNEHRDRPDKRAASPVLLRAGPLDLFFEPETGFIRHVRLGGHEIIRAIYGAVRDRNWGTVQPVFRDYLLRQPNETSFEIRFAAECHDEEIHYVWDGRITGDETGSIRFEFSGEALGDFHRNRIGLCVLHPIRECSGKACVIEHSNGVRESTRFPEFIAPFQPFTDVHAIQHEIRSGVVVEGRFEGEVFETEDQRNWTDASFKTYGTPLAKPFPVLVRKGERVTQVVTIRLLGAKDLDATTAAVAADLGSHHKNADVVVVDFERIRDRHPIGFGVAAADARMTSPMMSCLRLLRPNHLRVDCRLWQADWEMRLSEAIGLVRAIDASLHVAIFISGDDDSELRRVAAVCAGRSAPISLWLVFHRAEKSTSSRWLSLACSILGPVAPGARFAAGTDANFAELNRNRTPRDADWFPCYSINPQVHAIDRLSMIENLAAQGDTVRTMRTFSTQPAVISPVTLSPRGNPVATSAPIDQAVPPADPRQSSFFGAAWTLGSLSVLLGEDPVHSLTYFETVGSRGLMDAMEEGGVYPVYHVFAGVAELGKLAEVEFLDGRAALRLAALAGVTHDGRRQLWLANLNPDPADVILDTRPMFKSASVHRLDEHHYQRTWQTPDAWRRTATGELLSGAHPRLVLPGFGLGVIEFLA